MLRNCSLNLCIVAAAMTGCARNTRDVGGVETGETGLTRGEARDEGSGVGGDAADDEPIIDDLERGYDDGVDGRDGCTKIDFLFVIDDSGSMFEFQQNLVASVPGFIEAIEEHTNVNDFHVMVVDSSVDSEQRCVDVCEFGTFDNSSCADFMDSCDAVEARHTCEGVLGAGVTHPRGAYSSQRDCGLAEERRFLDGERGDLLSAFECIAQVGTTGMGDEQPYNAMAAALERDGAAADCNGTFLRDDAILVVTVLSDAGADTTGEVPFRSDHDALAQGWHDAVIAAKRGNSEAAILMSFHHFSNADATCPTRVGAGSAWAPDAYHNVPTAFGERGFEASVCLDDYAPAFTAAVDTIAGACADFVPVG